MNDSELSIRVASAINDGYHINNLSSEEKQRMTRIEDLRKLLSESNEMVEIVDYRAGMPQSNRSENEMYEGTDWVGMISSIVKTCSKSQKWALILFKLIREFKHLVAVELGTSWNFSSISGLSSKIK